MINYFKIKDGHLFRLMADYCCGEHVIPNNNTSDTAWKHVCKPGKCGRIVVNNNIIKVKGEKQC